MTHPVAPDPQKAPPRLHRIAPWVDLFFKLSAGLAAIMAIWRDLR